MEALERMMKTMNTGNAIGYGPLTFSEKTRFLKSGPGSDSAGRWLQAVLFALCNYDNPHGSDVSRPLSMDDPRDRALIVSDDFRYQMSGILAYIERGSRGGIDENTVMGSVRQMEPMTAYSADTLIRFSMTRHDATDLFCSKRIGDPVVAMMDTIRTEAETIRNPTFPTGAYMIRHMAIPVATHPSSTLQGIVNAVCYGAHGNGRRDQSRVNGMKYSKGHAMLMDPLSGTMEYSGPDCDPRLIAMMLEEDGFSVLRRSYNDRQLETMIVSMPGVVNTGIRNAASGIIDMFADLKSYSPFSLSHSYGTAWRLPVTDYETMSGALKDGRYAKIASCFNAGRRIPDMDSNLCMSGMGVSAAMDGIPCSGNPDGLPDTYAMMVERLKRRGKAAKVLNDCDAARENRGYGYGVFPDMADIAYALTFERPASTDWTMVRDLLMDMKYHDSALADKAALLPAAEAWSWFAATLPLRNPVISDATMIITGMLIDFSMMLISTVRSMPGDRIGIMLIPSDALYRFFDDMSHSLSYDFALQTLMSASYVGEDKGRDPDFHGLAMVMPYDINVNGEIMPYPIISTLFPATIDPIAGEYPHTFMIP